MAKEKSLGVRSIDMITLAYKCLETAVVIECKHNRDNTDQTKQIDKIVKELGDMLRSEGIDPFET